MNKYLYMYEIIYLNTLIKIYVNAQGKKKPKKPFDKLDKY